MPKKDPDRIRIVCRTCSGKGRVTKKVQMVDRKTGKTDTAYVEELCNNCAGMGFQWG